MATPTTLPSTFVAGNVLTAAEMNALRGAFRILQVVSTTKTDTFSASTDNDGTPSPRWVSVTGLTATITPSATSSKVFVLVQLSVGRLMTYRLTRGGTAIGVADAAGDRQQGSGSGVAVNTTSLMTPVATYLDSPSTTSAITYGVDVANNHSNSTTQTVYVNRTEADADQLGQPRGVSTITVMEVSA